MILGVLHWYQSLIPIKAGLCGVRTLASTQARAPNKASNLGSNWKSCPSHVINTALSLSSPHPSPLNGVPLRCILHTPTGQDGQDVLLPSRLNLSQDQVLVGSDGDGNTILLNHGAQGFLGLTLDAPILQPSERGGYEGSGLVRSSASMCVCRLYSKWQDAMMNLSHNIQQLSMTRATRGPKQTKHLSHTKEPGHTTFPHCKHTFACLTCM